MAMGKATLQGLDDRFGNASDATGSAFDISGSAESGFFSPL